MQKVVTNKCSNESGLHSLAYNNLNKYLLNSQANFIKNSLI